jgi:hypothetical protein
MQLQRKIKGERNFSEPKNLPAQPGEKTSEV